MRLRLGLLLAAAALLACSRDLAVPAATTAPAIAAFSPASGSYAGERLVITGSGFDPDPQANLVQFARASARAEWVGGGSLAVRIPADAGSGRITLATKGGISAPSSVAFTYRGLGELRTGVVSSEIALLHRPYRVVPASDETFLLSDLLLGVVRYGDPAFVAPAAVSIDSAPATATPSVVWLDSYPGRPTSTLVREEVPSGTFASVRAATKTIPEAGAARLVTMRAGGGFPDAVAVIRDEGSTWTIALHGLVDLEPLPAWPDPTSAGTPQPLAGIVDLRGCADAGNGDLACLARGAADDPLTIARIRLTSAPTVTFLAPPPAPIVENRYLSDDPLCADVTRHRAVVALADGRIAAANVSTDTWFQAPVDTESRTPARFLTCVGPGSASFPEVTALVSKVGDDLLTRMEPVTGQVVWTIPFTKPAATGLWCTAQSASCANGGVIHAASDADNRVFLLDVSSGAVLARRSFDLLPGRVDDPDAIIDLTAVQGAAWFATSSAPDVPKLSFATAAPRGTLWMPVTAKRGSGLYPHFAASDAVAVVPGVTGTYTMVLEDAAFDGNALTSTAQLGLDAPNPYAHAATIAGLETLTYHLGSPTERTVSAIPDARFTSLGRLPDGRIFASVRSGAGWSVRTWTAAEAAADAVWTSPGAGALIVASSAVLDGALWAFYWGEGSDLHGVALDGNLVAKSDAVLSDAFYSILAVSPNGRTFVSWDFQPYSRDTSVVVWSASAAEGFRRRTTIPVQGQVSGVAFDGTGEALYVVTRGPDRVLVIE